MEAQNLRKGTLCDKVFSIIVGIADIVVTMISIIVTIIGIWQATKDRDQKSDRPGQV